MLELEGTPQATASKSSSANSVSQRREDHPTSGLTRDRGDPVVVGVVVHDRQSLACGNGSDDQVRQPDAPLVAGAASGQFAMNAERLLPVRGRGLDDPRSSQCQLDPIVLGGVAGAIEVLDEDRLAEGDLIRGQGIGHDPTCFRLTCREDQGARIE